MLPERLKGCLFPWGYLLEYRKILLPFQDFYDVKVVSLLFLVAHDVEEESVFQRELFLTVPIKNLLQNLLKHSFLRGL